MNRHFFTSTIFMLTILFSRIALSVTDVGAIVDLSNSYHLNKRVFGIHGELLWSPLRLGSPKLSKIYNDVGFQDIRLPGGAAGNLYLSQSEKFGCNRSGVSEEAKNRIKNFNNALSHNNRTYSTKDFLDFIKQAKTNFTLIVNVLCDTPENTRKWMEEIRDHGITVKYVEMGSEYYFNNYLWAFPTPADYIRQASKYALEVRKVFPDVKIAVDTSASSYRSRYFPDFSMMDKSERSRRGLEYDKQAAAALFANAFDVHIYSPLGLTKLDKALDTIDNYEAYKNAISYFDKRFKPAMQYLHKLKPDKRVWITEWGTAFYGWRRKHEPDFVNSYYNALFVTNSLLTYFSIPYIESANYHNFPYLWRDFTKLVPNPLYHAMRLFKEPISLTDTVSPITFNAIKSLQNNVSYKENVSDLNSILFYKNNAGYLIVVNKFNKHYSLDSFSTIGKASNIQVYNYEQIVPDLHSGDNLTKAKLYNRLINKYDNVDIPPYSITKIYLKINTVVAPSKQTIQ